MRDREAKPTAAAATRWLAALVPQTLTHAELRCAKASIGCCASVQTEAAQDSPACHPWITRDGRNLPLQTRPTTARPKTGHHPAAYRACRTCKRTSSCTQRTGERPPAAEADVLFEPQEPRPPAGQWLRRRTGVEIPCPAPPLNRKRTEYRPGWQVRVSSGTSRVAPPAWSTTLQRA